MSTLLNIESQSGGINVIKPNIKNQETNDFNKIDNKSDQKTKKEDEFVYPNFKDIKVSTRTFIGHTNITIDINSLFQSLPITPYEHVPKKRGRKYIIRQKRFFEFKFLLLTFYKLKSSRTAISACWTHFCKFINRSNHFIWHTFILPTIHASCFTK